MNKNSNPITKILFVCHGNICRSPMAEMVMKELIRQNNLEDNFFIESAACHTDEIGNPMHHGIISKLIEKNIPFTDHRARLITQSDYAYYDLIIAMDDENMFDLRRNFGSSYKEKCHKLLEYKKQNRDVADPWYTHNFDATWDDILSGCKELLKALTKV